MQYVILFVMLIVAIVYVIWASHAILRMFGISDDSSTDTMSIIAIPILSILLKNVPYGGLIALIFAPVVGSLSIVLLHKLANKAK